jgi:hypothetical protein
MKPFSEVSLDYKNAYMRRWRVIEVVLRNGSRNRHVWGHDVLNKTVRASSAIKNFDREAMLATTDSGRIYKLIGHPDNSRKEEYEYAWKNWCRINGVVSEVDVTDEYFSFDKTSINPAPSSLKKSQEVSTSLLSSVKGFFGLLHADESKKAQIRTEINLMNAINAHVKWKVRLQDYLDGTSQEKLDPKIICRDDQCVLGKWIQGPALKHFHEDENFRQLRADHAQFHYVAGNVVKHVQANQRAAADALLDGAYKHASHDVVQALIRLNKYING